MRHGYQTVHTFINNRALNYNILAIFLAYHIKKVFWIEYTNAQLRAADKWNEWNGPWARNTSSDASEQSAASARRLIAFISCKLSFMLGIRWRLNGGITGILSPVAVVWSCWLIKLGCNSRGRSVVFSSSVFKRRGEHDVRHHDLSGSDQRTLDFNVIAWTLLPVFNTGAF